MVNILRGLYYEILASDHTSTSHMTPCTATTQSTEARMRKGANQNADKQLSKKRRRSRKSTVHKYSQKKQLMQH